MKYRSFPWYLKACEKPHRAARSFRSLVPEPPCLPDVWASTFFDRVIKSAMSGDGTHHPNG
jgi:hypothetical protein